MVCEYEFDFMDNLKIKSIFCDVLKLVKPSIEVHNDNLKSVNFVVNSVEKFLLKNNFDAEVKVGGSFGKNTYLATSFDVDCFVRFRGYDDSKLSDMLDVCFDELRSFGIDVFRVHGSRDYFQFNYNGIDFEFVPVSFIESYSQMANSTDLSSLHVDYVLNKAKVISNLQDEIRLAKQFFKGIKCYGAESYVRGFSGHVIDLLIIKYGSLVNLLRVASSDWTYLIESGKRIVIDLENNLKKLEFGIDESKINSSLVIVDPIQIDRNSSAALSEDVLKKFVLNASDFLSNPLYEFFVEHHLTEAELLNLDGNVVSIMCCFDRNKRDVVGSKALKIYEFLLKQFKILDFNVVDSGFEFFSSGFYSLMYFEFESFVIDDEFVKVGPPVFVNKACDNFRRVHGSLVYESVDDKGVTRLYAKLNRKFSNVFDYLKVIRYDTNFILKNCKSFVILNKFDNDNNACCCFKK